MNSIADQYEAWFRMGNRDIAEFVANHESNGNVLSDEQFRDCLLTDQYLRHQLGDPPDVSEYGLRLERVAKDESLQIELWLEAFGYFEEKGSMDRESRDAFLLRIPEPLRAAIADEIRDDEQSESLSPSADVAPPKIPRYRIEGEIGKGSFGTVYRGWDTQLERAVAVKVLRADQPSDSLFTEARLVASLENPGIVSVYDCGIEEGGRAFFVTAIVNGLDLRDWLKTIDRSEYARVCRLFASLCRSLDRAHQAGVVHRDIKPGNIIVQEGDEPVLLDFGLATRDWQSGKKGELVGTPAYMSPEQARGEGHLVDARSDIFSIGILLLESLAGQLPWESHSSREMIREIAHGQVRTARHFDELIPIEIDRICSKATATAMFDRYGSAAELAADLAWFIDENPRPDRQRAIAPRGLQPYTCDDAESYWQLLPGQRNAKGEPDRVRWWLDRLQDGNGIARNVLVLYGPSGSGKSSLLGAGVIPFADSSRTRCVEIDTSELSESKSLSQQLAAWLSELPGNGSLAEQFASVRNSGDAKNETRRTVIVFDQFEQIFRAGFEESREELFRAMRQADGERLQFVLVVRDEFWSAISDWMRRLESPLRDGRNAMALGKFNRSHAMQVMRVWAEALSVSVKDDFVAKAVDSVADGERVVPVRLALLARILGEEDWTDQQLNQISSHSSPSGYYLDSVLGDLAPSAQRKLVQPAKEILRSLTPASGQIRGPSKSKQELLVACRDAGQRVTKADFEILLDLLERQLHLLTPVENENAIDESQSSMQYQLPHDFLVSEIRRWLETQDRQSLAGRASSDLRFAASRWTEDHRTSNLAGPIDCLRFSLFARSAGIKGVERQFLISSARKHLLRSLLVVAMAASLFAVFQTVLQRSRGYEIVQRLLSCTWDDLPAVVEESRKNKNWTQGPLDVAMEKASIDEAGYEQRDRIALALLRDNPSQSAWLAERLALMTPQANLVFAGQMGLDLLEKDRSAVASQLAAIASDETQTGTERLKAAIAIGLLAPEHSYWSQSSEQVCQLLVDANPTDLGWLAKGLFPVRKQLVEALTRGRDQRDAARNRTATFLLAEFAADDPEAQIDLIEEAAIVHLDAIFSTIRDTDSRGNLDRMLKVRFAASVAKWNLGQVEKANEARESSSVALARRIGNLGAALILRGHGESVVEQLRFRENPTVRSYLIHCYAAGNGPAQPLVDMLAADTLTDDVAAAILQMIGSLPASSKVPSSIRELAKQLYRNSENAELNSTAEWFLRRHGYQADLDDATMPAAIGFRTSEGHTMIRLPGGIKARVGGSAGDRNQLPNEKPHDIDVPDNVFISRDELTARQLAQFIASTEGESSHQFVNRSPHDREVRMGFFIAAAYCNWLSEKEGIPEDQWCYLPNRGGEIGPGMRIADDHLQRSGFQIPTADLWEYACRGGASSPRPFGIGLELSSRYVRWSGSSSSSRQRSTARLPNAFGLVDMLGNGAEWSTGLVDGMMEGPNRSPDFNSPPRSFSGMNDQGNGRPRNQEGQRRRPPRNRSGRFRTGQPGMAFGGGPILIESMGKTIERSNQFAILGGAFDSPAHKIRSSDRSIISPTMTNKPVTLRLMRIVPNE